MKNIIILGLSLLMMYSCKKEEVEYNDNMVSGEELRSTSIDLSNGKWLLVDAKLYTRNSIKG